MTDELLPALPEPAGHDGIPAFNEYFTADQLHAYAREAIRQALAALPGGGVEARDAKRYRWLKSRLLCADFDYGQGVDRRAVVVFEWPEGARISANLDASIDALQAAPGGSPEVGP